MVDTDEEAPEVLVAVLARDVPLPEGYHTFKALQAS